MNKKILLHTFVVGSMALASLPGRAETDTRCLGVASAALKIADHRVHGIAEEHIIETTTQTAAAKRARPALLDFTMRMIQSIYHDDAYRNLSPLHVSEAWLKDCDAKGYVAMESGQ